MGDEKKELLLAQWQTCVEMANYVSQRRDTMNNIFATLNLGILGAVSVMWDFKSLLIIGAGIVLCVIWMMLIRNFRMLNMEKFHVIIDIEQKLPEQPFTKEQELLNNNVKYHTGTKLERFLPILFVLIYIIAFSAIVVIAIRNGGTVS